MQSCQYGAFERQSLHHHADTRLIVVLSGAFREEGFAAAGDFKRGDIIVRPAFVSHGDVAVADGARYLQFIEPPGFLKMNGWRHGWGARRGRLDLTLPAVRRALASKRAAHFIADCITDIAYAPAKEASSIEAAAMRLAQDRSSSIAGLAQEIRMRPDRLSKRFKKRFGVSPQIYAGGARLERAKALLASGGGSLAEIAASCGYFDQSHLCRSLKQALAMTPLEFHRLARC